MQIAALKPLSKRNLDMFLRGSNLKKHRTKTNADIIRMLFLRVWFHNCWCWHALQGTELPAQLPFETRNSVHTTAHHDELQAVYWFCPFMRCLAQTDCEMLCDVLGDDCGSIDMHKSTSRYVLKVLGCVGLYSPFLFSEAGNFSQLTFENENWEIL